MLKEVGTNHEGKTIYLNSDMTEANGDMYFRDGKQVYISFFFQMLKNDLFDAETRKTPDYNEALRILESGQEIRVGQDEHSMHSYRVRKGDISNAV